MAAASQQTLTGAVYDSSGNPAVGVRVVVTPTWGAVDTTKTDANGEYSVNWQSQPGMRDVKYFVIARDVERNLAAMEAIGTNTTRMVLRLGPGLSVSGTVQDAKGAPLPRANINLNLMAGNMGGMVEYEPIKMDSDGTFTIPALPMGQQYHVYASASGYGSAKQEHRENSKPDQQPPVVAVQTEDRRPPVRRQGTGCRSKTVARRAGQHQRQRPAERQPDHGRDRTFQVQGLRRADKHLRVVAFGRGRNNSGNSQARGGDINVIVKMGVQQQQRQAVERETPLKPQPWTLNALAAWPANHKTGAIILLSLQAALLLGTAGGIFWFTRKRG